MKAGLESVGFAGKVPDSVGGLIARDFEGGERLFGNGLVINLGHVGKPGHRKWGVLNETEWLPHLMSESKIRAEYTTKDRHVGRSESPPLLSLYSRLPPWLATVVGDVLERRGDEGLEELVHIVREFADAFAEEAKVDVVGVAVHRENDRDLHVHLVLSESREVVFPKKTSKRFLERRAREISAERIAERKAAGVTGAEVGRNKVMKEVRAELAGAQEMKVEMRRAKRSRSWRMLGPSFRGKLALWEMSGRDPKVAECNDRLPKEENSFRAVVAEPVSRGEDITRTFLDLWSERWLVDRFDRILDDGQRQQVRLLGKAAVERYLKWGKEHPAMEDIVANEVEAQLDDISPEVARLRAENGHMRRELRDLDAVKAILDNAPENIRRATREASAKTALRMARPLAEMRSAGAELLRVFPAMNEAISKVASSISVEAASAWELFWNLFVDLVLPEKGKNRNRTRNKGKSRAIPSVE